MASASFFIVSKSSIVSNRSQFKFTSNIHEDRSPTHSKTSRCLVQGIRRHLGWIKSHKAFGGHIRSTGGCSLLLPKDTDGRQDFVVVVFAAVAVHKSGSSRHGQERRNEFRDFFLCGLHLLLRRLGLLITSSTLAVFKVPGCVFWFHDRTRHGIVFRGLSGLGCGHTRQIILVGCRINGHDAFPVFVGFNFGRRRRCGQDILGDWSIVASLL
mmetsp:Transcript_18576/g.46065  ORF Transcript_18576/g.46065 Transcript_18576/m.46065 type:complete len:212 (+) Transcript_18576:1471-2106(+)